MLYMTKSGLECEDYDMAIEAYLRTVKYCNEMEILEMGETKCDAVLGIQLDHYHSSSQSNFVYDMLEQWDNFHSESKTDNYGWDSKVFYGPLAIGSDKSYQRMRSVTDRNRGKKTLSIRKEEFEELTKDSLPAETRDQMIAAWLKCTENARAGLHIAATPGGADGVFSLKLTFNADMFSLDPTFESIHSDSGIEIISDDEWIKEREGSKLNSHGVSFWVKPGLGGGKVIFRVCAEDGGGKEYADYEYSFVKAADPKVEAVRSTIRSQHNAFVIASVKSDLKGAQASRIIEIKSNQEQLASLNLPINTNLRRTLGRLSNVVDCLIVAKRSDQSGNEKKLRQEAKEHLRMAKVHFGELGEFEDKYPKIVKMVGNHKTEVASYF